jgi:hypothetical protein
MWNPLLDPLPPIVRLIVRLVAILATGWHVYNLLSVRLCTQPVEPIAVPYCKVWQAVQSVFTRS